MAESENIGSIYYTVEADTGEVLDSVQRFDKGLDDLEASVKKVDGSVNKANKSMQGLSSSVQRSARESDKAKTNFAGLAKVIGGLLSVQGLGSIIQMAEGYNEMAERIRMATADQQEFERVQGRLLETANGTYRALSEAQEVYIRTADSLRSLGYNTDQVLDITDSLSYAFVKNASSTMRADNALQAYAKSVNKGRVDADAWESIIAAIPTVINDIAEASGKTSAEIRKLGASGDLTARMLNEGLRNSLESNRKAADGMAITVRDAFRSFNNNLSAYLGQSSDVISSTQTIAKTIRALGENIDTLVAGFLALGAGAMAKYIYQAGESALASARAGLAARALAVEELNLAKAEAQVTAAKLAHARANVSLTGSTAAVTAAQTAQAAAATRLAAATAAVGTVGGRLVGLLGGPVGLIATVATVASGYMLMRNSGEKAGEGVKNLAKSFEELIAIREQMKEGGPVLTPDETKFIEDATVKIKEYELAILELINARNRLAAAGDTMGANQVSEEANRLGKQIQTLREQISLLEKKASETNLSPNADQEETDSKKRLKAMRDELALAKLVGDARLELQAIQKLGANATEKEKKEAAFLAVEIERLNKSHKELEETQKAARDAALQNVEVIAELSQQLGLAALEGEALAEAKAKMKLNPAATPEEIAQVEALARALHSAEEAAKRRKEIGEDPVAYIRGEVDPLQGGPFDTQMARFKEEEKLEQERYAKQLERMKTQQEAQQDIYVNYLALQEQLYQEHSNRMQQIEEAKNAAILASGEQAFGAIADVIRAGAGKANAAYRTVFAISKAFAIAQATLNLNSAIMQAFSDQTAMTPQQKMANAAAVAGAAGQFLSAIGSVSFGGGRRHGGSTRKNTMYEVNEDGVPEMLAVGGKEFLMMGNRGGRVTPLDKTRGAGLGNSSVSNVYVNVKVDGEGRTETNATQGYERFGRDVGEFVDQRFNQMMAESMRPGGMLWNASNGRR